MDNNMLDLLERIKSLEAENLILKQQKVEIIEAKELYLKIFEEFPALIWRSRLDKLCDYFNKTWLDFTGKTLAQEFGNGWAEGVHPDDFDSCLQIYVTAFDKREPFLMEYRLLNKFGEYRWIRDIGRPFYDLDNTFLGYIGSCYDITDNKNNEFKLIELNTSKDLFMQILAHDLKTPLIDFLNITKILCEEFNNLSLSKIHVFSKELNETGSNLYKLLENLLEWVGIQRNTILFNPQELPLMQILNEDIVLLKEKAVKKGIEFTIDLPDDLKIFADRIMLKSILRNLINNAIKYTQRGGKVMIKGSKTFDNKIKIEVIDNGIGISEDIIDKLFKIDRRIYTIGTEGETGSGLGLILCKEFVDKHNGTIEVSSQIDKGTSFITMLAHSK